MGQVLATIQGKFQESEDPTSPRLRGPASYGHRGTPNLEPLVLEPNIYQLLLSTSGKQWRQRQLRKITDRVFDHFKDDYGKDHLAFEDLYIAVLFVYNDINKHLPGPHIDPPSKASVKALMEAYDVNLDGQLNREEFYEFIQKMTAETLSVVSRNMMIAVIVAPVIALLTKRATEGVPHVGKVVQRIPNAVYASIITLGVVLLQKSGEEFE